MRAIKNGKIILEKEIIENKIVLYDNKIINIVESVDEGREMEWIDAQGNYVAPGFMDIHFHGAYGYDTMDEDPRALMEMRHRLCENGITSFLPTTMTMEQERIYKALENIKGAMEQDGGGAKILGAHLEGPFIHPLRKGAQREEYMMKPNYEVIERFLDVIKIITLAPELDANFEFLTAMQQHPHIVLSIGHSNATYQEAMEAMEKGIHSATHLFNAMTGLHHREPGVVGAVLNTEIYCELIADGIHVHPGLFSMLKKVKGPDRIILITDSIRASCMKCGQYELGGQWVEVESGMAKLKDGTLAGSVIRMNEALGIFRRHTSDDLPSIIGMASLNPARLLGIHGERGSIAIGKYADMVIFNKEFEILSTIVEGRLCYRRREATCGSL